jgi:hypothetical protein
MLRIVLMGLIIFCMGTVTSSYAAEISQDDHFQFGEATTSDQDFTGVLLMAGGNAFGIQKMANTTGDKESSLSKDREERREGGPFFIKAIFPTLLLLVLVWLAFRRVTKPQKPIKKHTYRK